MLEDNDDQVVAYFEDGSRTSGDLLVGCDGSLFIQSILMISGPDIQEKTDLKKSMFNFRLHRIGKTL